MSTRTGVLDAGGRSATRQAAVQDAGPGGTVVLPGLHDQETSFDVHALIRSQGALLGSYASSEDDGRRAASLLEEDQVPLGPMCDVRPPSRGPDAFAEVVEREAVATKGVLVLRE